MYLLSIDIIITRISLWLFFERLRVYIMIPHYNDVTKSFEMIKTLQKPRRIKILITAKTY